MAIGFGPGSNMMRDYDRNRNLAKRDSKGTKDSTVGYKELKKDNHSFEKMEEIHERQRLLAIKRKRANLITFLVILFGGIIVFTVIMILLNI